MILDYLISHLKLSQAYLKNPYVHLLKQNCGKQLWDIFSLRTQLLQSMISCQVGLNSTSKRPQKWLKITFAFLSISFQGINIFQFFKKWVKLDERALLTSYHLWILIICMTSIIWSKISDFYQNFQFFSDNFDSLIVLSLVFCYYMGLILLYMR